MQAQGVKTSGKQGWKFVHVQADSDANNIRATNETIQKVYKGAKRAAYTKCPYLNHFCIFPI